MTRTATGLPDIVSTLRLPVVAAPMLTVSKPDLVVAACRVGVAGGFPSANCSSSAQLAEWLKEIDQRVAAPPEAGHPPGPVCVNLIVHRSNPRLEEDAQVVAGSRADVIITSVGAPGDLVADLHRHGQLVWADVASLRHLDRAAAAGVDGVVLLTAGAGGQTGWANPFAFVRAARARFDGTIALAGGLADGASIAAAQMLGADLAYCGTRFIATTESAAPAEYKSMIRASELDDILLTDKVTGLPANMLRPSVEGIEDSAESGGFDVATTLGSANGGRSRWADAWSAGHVVSIVDGVPTVGQLVDTLSEQYRKALAG